MSGEAAKFALFPGGHPAHAGSAPDRQLQELWFSIARRPWASLVLVPADASLSTAWIATGLAEVGTRLRDTPVNAIVAERIDYASVRSISELQPRLEAGRAWEGSVEVEPGPTATVGVSDPTGHGGRRHDATLMPPFGRVIIAVQPVVCEPLAVAIAHAADAAVLCVRMGDSRMRAARRTVELIGADRVLGAFLVR